jgi:hypothetical protein
LVAEFGWLPGDQGPSPLPEQLASMTKFVRPACHAVPGLGEVITVEVQPDNGEILSLL